MHFIRTGSSVPGVLFRVNYVRSVPSSGHVVNILSIAIALYSLFIGHLCTVRHSQNNGRRKAESQTQSQGLSWSLAPQTPPPYFNQTNESGVRLWTILAYSMRVNPNQSLVHLCTCHVSGPDGGSEKLTIAM